MLSPDIVSSVSLFLKKHLESLKLSKSGKLTTGGSDYYSEKNRPFHRLYNKLSRDNQKLFVDTYQSKFLEMDDPEFDEFLIKELRDLFGEKVKEPVDWDAARFNDVITTPMSKLLHIYTLDDTDRGFLYDPVLDIHHDRIKTDVIEAKVKYLFGDDASKWYATNRVDCFLKYIPLNPNKLVEDEVAQARYFNTWEDAEWKKGWAPELGTPCPPELMEVMNSVFPAPMQMHVWNWFRDAIFSRAESHFVLRGVPGLGKNALFEAFLKPMVGEKNHGKAEYKFEDTAFHGKIGSVRVFLFDEFPLESTLKELLKMWHNDTATLSEKYEKTGLPQDMHASFIVCNNYKRRIKMEFSDRKFFIPDVNSVPLREAIGQEKINIFYELCKNDYGFLRRAASYIYCNYPHKASKIFPKTETFKEICLGSYESWFRKLMFLAHKSKKVTAKAVIRYNKSIDAYVVQDTLEHYESNFGSPLGKLRVIPDGSWYLESFVCEEPPTNSNLPVNEVVNEM